MSHPGATRTNNLASWALVAAALGLIVWRGPQYLAAPSFWAEDGMLFFAGAWNHGAIAGLVQRPSGYLNLWANLATSLAAGLVGSHVIPLAAAPRITAGAGLVAQLAPIALVAFARAPAWGGVVRRGAAIAVVLVGGRTGGMWLNAINSQYFLALAAIVVLLEPAAMRRTRRWAYAAVVGMAGLAGPVASFVTPLFLWKAWRTRARSTTVLAAVAFGCTGVQLWCVGLAGAAGLSVRGQGPSVPALAVAAWMRTVVLPLFGSDAAVAFAGRLAPMLAPIATPVAPSALVIAGLLLLTLALAVAILALGVVREVRWWLAGSYAVVTAGSFLGAVGGTRALLGGIEAGARYGFVPSVLLLWLLLLNVRPGRRAQSLGCATLVAIAIGNGAWQWRQTLRWHASWPSWSAEVAAWEREPATPLRIWPRGWTMVLAPRR